MNSSLKVDDYKAGLFVGLIVGSIASLAISTLSLLFVLYG